MSDQIKARRRGNPNWRKGVSGNPAGRPRIGQSLAERVRALVDPDEVIEFLQGVWRNEAAPLLTRLRAAEMLTERGWGKAVQAIDLEAHVTARAEGAYDHLTEEELDALEAETLAELAASEARALLPPGKEARTPSGAASTPDSRHDEPTAEAEIVPEPGPAEVAIAAYAARARQGRRSAR